MFTGVFTRSDIIERAKINKNDSVFEKLKKYAKLDSFEEEFYIKAD